MSERTELGLQIRAARENELDGVAELTVLAYTRGTSLDPQSDYVQHLRRVRERSLSSPLLVALIDSRLVGSVSLCPYGTQWSEIARPGELELRMLAVNPDAWGLGIADALIDATVLAAIERGDSALAISVIDDNAPAHRLYARHGFLRRPERDWDPTPEAHLLVYTRDL